MHRYTRSDSQTYTSRNSYSDDSYSEEEQVEAELYNLDDEIDDTEAALSSWSPSSPYSGSGSSQSHVSLPSLLGTHSSRYPPASNDPRIRLSHITEQTEPASRPVSGVSSHTQVPQRPRSAFASGHGRAATDSDLPPPGRANELIGLFEATTTYTSTSGSRPSSPTKSSGTGYTPTSSGYTRSYTPSSGFTRSHTPTSGFTRSHTPTSGYTRSHTPTSAGYTASSMLSPPPRPSTVGGTLSTSAFTPSGGGTYTSQTPSYTTPSYTTPSYTTGTSTVTPTAQSQTTLRRSSPTRSPLSSVRNIVALWKERSPKRASGSGAPPSPREPTSPTPFREGEDLFGLRRRASGRSSNGNGEGAGDRGSASPSIDVSELSKFIGGNGSERPLHLGTLYYLNVHSTPPFRWEKCHALLYRHTLLLSWLSPATHGRAVVQLDLVNCLTAESALTLGHPRAQDDVGSIAAREQDAELGIRGVGEGGLVERLIPFWMVYGDGVERLATESLVERQRWLGRIWEAINNPPTPSVHSVSRAPSLTGSIRTIRSDSSTSSNGSRSTVYIPRVEDIPSINGSRSGSGSGDSSASEGRYHSFSDEGTSYAGSVSGAGVGNGRYGRWLDIPSHHTRTVDDTVISDSGDEYLYPGNGRGLKGRRVSARLRRSGSMTDLGDDGGVGMGAGGERRYVGSSAETASLVSGGGDGNGEEGEQWVTAESQRSSGVYETTEDPTQTTTRSYTTDPTRSYTDTYTGTYTTDPTRSYTGTYTTDPTRTYTTDYTRTTTSGDYTTRSGTGTYTSDGYTNTYGSSPYTRFAFSPLFQSPRVNANEKTNRTGTFTTSSSPYTTSTGLTGTRSYTNTYTYTGTGTDTRTYTQTETGTPYTTTNTLSYTTSPSALSRTREVRRRTRRSSFSSSSQSHSSNSGYQPSASDESSDKENESLSGSGSGSGGLASGLVSGTRSSETGYDICPSSDLSTLERRTGSSGPGTYDSTQPSDSSSSDSSSESGIGTSGSDAFKTATSTSNTSTEYVTATTPKSPTVSVVSLGVESLTRIPSIYSSASEGSERYKTASEHETEFMTPGVGELEEIPDEGLEGEGTPRASSIASSLPPLPESEPEVEEEEEVVSLVDEGSKTPSVVPSIPRSRSSGSVSSPSDVSVSVRPEDVPLPSSVPSEVEMSASPSSVTSLQLPPPTTEMTRTVSSESLLTTEESELGEESGEPSSIHFTEEEGSLESVEPPTTIDGREEMEDEDEEEEEVEEEESSVITPSAETSSSTVSSASATPMPATTTVPSTSFGLSTESSLTPTLPSTSRAPSTRAPSTLHTSMPTIPPSTPSIPPSPTPWASETNLSYESSQLEPSPSLRSVALHEGPDVSFETSFLRATASYSSLGGRSLTIPPTPVSSAPSSSRRLPRLTPVQRPQLPGVPEFDLGGSVATPSTLIFPESELSLSRSGSVRSTASGTSETSITSSMLDSTSTLDEMEAREREMEERGSLRLSEVETEPSLLSTPRASRVGSPPSVRSFSTVTPSASISVSVSTPQGDRPSTRSTLYTVQSSSLRPPSPTSFSRAGTPRMQMQIPPYPDYTDEFNHLLEEIRTYDQNREDENRDMGHTLRDLQNEIRDISEFLRRPRPMYAEERVGSSKAASSLSAPTQRGGRGSPVIRDITLPPPRPMTEPMSSAASSISFLSSHHSDDWTLYGDGSRRRDSPIPTPVDSEFGFPRDVGGDGEDTVSTWHITDSGSGSSPTSSPTSTSVSLTESSSMFPLPTPTPPRTFLESEAPTPPPLSSSPSTTSVSVSTVRAPSVAPVNPIPWLNEIRDQVRGLWEGQLSTNNLLDQLRDRPVPDNAELLDRMARVEDLLRLLGDQARQQPPPQPQPPVMMHMPVPVPPPAPSSDAGTEMSDISLDRILRGFEQRAPVAPTAVRAGPTLAEQLDELLRGTERPPRSPFRMPDPVRQISILMPGERSPSPSIRLQMPDMPERVYTAPLPEHYEPRHPVRRMRDRRGAPTGPPPMQPSVPPTAPSVPETEREEEPIEMGNIPREGDVEGDATPMPQRPRYFGPPPEPIPVPGSQAFRDQQRRAQSVPPTSVGAPPGESWYRPTHPPGPGMPQPQPGIVPGVVPPPGALGHMPDQQRQQQAGAQAGPSGLQYVPMPPAPITFPGMDELLESVRNTRLSTMANEAQTHELLRYMQQLNAWLERDVRDRQSELRGVIANVDALRNQLANLGRPGAGEPSESESSSSSGEGTPQVGYVPGMTMPVPQQVGPFPPGFVPQEEAVIPPRMPEGGEPPVIPGVVPTPGLGAGMPPPPIIINQPGQPGYPGGPYTGVPGPPPVIPMDGFAGPPGTMQMPVPHTGVPMPMEPPFIPPPDQQPTVIQMQASPSGSGSSSSSSTRSRSPSRSRSRSHSRTPRSSRRHPSTRSRSPHRFGDVAHSPPPIPVPPTVVPHPDGGPPLVTVMPPSQMAPSELRAGTPRHPDMGQAAGPTIINIPPQAVQQPGVPGMVPGGMMPPAEVHQVLRRALHTEDALVHVHDLAHLEAIVPEARVADVHVVEADQGLTPALLHVTRAPIPRQLLSDLKSSWKSKSATSTHIRSTFTRNATNGNAPHADATNAAHGTAPIIVHTGGSGRDRSRSRSRSRSSGRHTPIIIPGGTQPSQAPIIVPGPGGQMPTGYPGTGYQPGMPMPGVPMTGAPGVPMTGAPGYPMTGMPTVMPSAYGDRPRSRSRSPRGRSRSRTPPSRHPTGGDAPVVVIPSGSYTDPARHGTPYDPRSGIDLRALFMKTIMFIRLLVRLVLVVPVLVRFLLAVLNVTLDMVQVEVVDAVDEVEAAAIVVVLTVVVVEGIVVAEGLVLMMTSITATAGVIDLGEAAEVPPEALEVQVTLLAVEVADMAVQVEHTEHKELDHADHGAPMQYTDSQGLPVPPPRTHTYQPSVAGTHRPPTVIEPGYPEGVPTTHRIDTHPEEHEALRHSTYAPGVTPSHMPPASAYEVPHSPPPISRQPTGRSGRSVRYEDEASPPDSHVLRTLPAEHPGAEARSVSDTVEEHGIPPFTPGMPPRTPTTPGMPPRTPTTPGYPPRTTATPVADLAREEADRERLARLDEVEDQLRHVGESAQQAEDVREEDFRRNEEDRQRLFLENEGRRDQIAAEARDAVMEQLDHVQRLLEQSQPPPAPPPTAPGDEPVLPVPAPAVMEDAPSIRLRAAPDDTISDRHSSILHDVASQHAREIREVIDMEREEMQREREAADAERQRVEQERAEAQAAADAARDDRIRDLEEELARVRAELEDERRQREEEKHQREIEEADLREREKAERDEQNENLNRQLGDITNLVNEQRGLMEEKKTLSDERHAEKIERRAKKDEDIMNLMAMMNKMQEDMQRDREVAEEARAAADAKPGFEAVIAELERQNAAQRELLERLSQEWRDDCERHHRETLDAVRETADEQVPFNIQGYLDDFSKALATEVRILLGEVGKLREERRGLQHEIGYLLCIRSKYGPGGEFEPDWKPQPGQPGGPPADVPPPPPPPPEPAPEMPQARPAWRSVVPRTSRRKKREAAAAAAAAAAPPPQPDPRAQTMSWATWQPDPHFVPTPPSVEPGLLVPEASSPGLFGPLGSLASSRQALSSLNTEQRQVMQTIFNTLHRKFCAPFYYSEAIQNTVNAVLTAAGVTATNGTSNLYGPGGSPADEPLAEPAPEMLRARPVWRSVYPRSSRRDEGSAVAAPPSPPQFDSAVEIDWMPRARPAWRSVCPRSSRRDEGSAVAAPSQFDPTVEIDWMPRARPVWRSVYPRSSRSNEGSTLAAPPSPPQFDPAVEIDWATWQRSPGLFGPRSPRSSVEIDWATWQPDPNLAPTPPPPD
ncbi:hypothetical protein VNI00_005412 [Paramarasmius palmivorus]|uniref:PH domain-containing protein n=1 Tax=Paramarasmius palmivorus TaxID=297713 RepID=A0AAW0DFC8_9AGAR